MKHEGAKTRLQLHTLEDRTIPSVSGLVSGGTLFLTGSPSIPRSEVRIEAGRGEVAVFEGPRRVDTFFGVQNFDVHLLGTTRVAFDLGVSRAFGDINVSLGSGTNSVRLASGQVDSVNIQGRAGTDAVTVQNFSIANALTANLAGGRDRMTVGQATVGSLALTGIETVQLGNTASVGSVAVVNESTPSATPRSFSTAAAIAGDISVIGAGGSYNLGGAIAGNVSVEAGPRALAPVSVAVSGQIGGGLTVVGTRNTDTVRLQEASIVAGDVRLSLGAGNDTAVLGGIMGTNASAAVQIDMGAGNDQVVLLGTVMIAAESTVINLGAGSDEFTEMRGTHHLAMTVDGGSEVDWYHGFIDADTQVTNVEWNQ